MGLLGDLSGSYGTSYNQSQGTNSAQNFSRSSNQSMSQTYANAANAFSAEQAEIAYQRALSLQAREMEFNRQEAQKSRDWETEMANTIYTRSVKNMIEAGINPILAANMGLSGASVGSGSTASISGASAPMAHAFMDTTSAASGSSEAYGESQGSSWSKGGSSSESGLATGLQLLGEAISGAIGKINSSQKIDIAFSGLEKMFPKGYDSKTYGQGVNGKKHSFFESPQDRLMDGLVNKVKQLVK